MALTKIPAGLLDTSSHVDFANNEKLRFGAGSDLQIYSDGTHSRIYESGSGLLIIRAGNFNINNADGSQSYITMSDGGATTLYHAGAAKLATESTGASVTGNLAVSGNLTVSGTTTELNTTNLNVTDKNIILNYHASNDTSSNADGAGITIQDAVNSSNDASITWVASSDEFAFSHPVGIVNTVGGDTVLNLTGTYGSGNNVALLGFARSGGAVAGDIRYTDATTDMEIGTSTAHKFSLKTSNTKRLTVDSAGKVGIGTMAPSKKLHVEDSSAYQLQLDGGNNFWNVGAGWSGYYDGYFLIANNSGDKLVIDSNGKVGIGTNGPARQLHLKGNGTNSGKIRVENDATDNYQLIEFTGDQQEFHVGVGNSAVGITGLRNKFYIYDSTDNRSDFVIDGTGKIGIGHDSPSAKLHIDQTGNTRNDGLFIERQGSTYGLNLYVDTSGYGIIGGNGGFTPDIMKLDFNLESVGIGTAPASGNKLQVGGKGYFGSVGTNQGDTAANMQTNAVLQLKPHDSNSTNMTFAQVNGGSGMGIQVSNGPQTAAWDIALNPYAGKVGIGLVAPEQKLHVEETGSGKQTAIRVANENTSAGAGPEILFTSGTSNYGASIWSYGTALNAADLYFNAGGNTPRLRILSDGNIDASTNSNTTALRLPNGTTGQRPTGATGMMRYNTTVSKVEAYIGSAWQSLASGFEANGGTETTATIGGISYKIHAFTSSGTFQVTSGSKGLDILIVAGGGGGGGSTAGGGGAGGLIYQTSVAAIVGSYTITIGAGGAGSRKSNDGAPNNTNGSNTTAFGYTAIGGGYGFSGRASGSRLANSGGSGGGGGYYSGNDIGENDGAAGTSGQGYAGGRGEYPSGTSLWGGAGGGGATAVGVDQSSTRAGGAGNNRSSIYGTTYGASGVFAGGGGGGAYDTNALTSGGAGGGGQGGSGNSNRLATSGTANTGGGGGGSGFYQTGPNPSGGGGGSGIVLIRYTL